MFTESMLQSLRTFDREIQSAVTRTYGQADSARRAASQILLDMYADRQREYLLEDIRKAITADDEQQTFAKLGYCWNVTSRIIDEGSVAYEQAPVITVKTKPASANAEPIDLTTEWKGEVDRNRRLTRRLPLLERMTNLQSNQVLLVSYRETTEGAGVVWDVYGPHTYGVVQHPNEPDQPLILAIDVHADDTDVKISGLPEGIAKIVWSPWWVRIFDARDRDVTALAMPQNVDGENPFGFLPSVVFRSKDPETDKFFGPDATQLVEKNRLVNLKNAEHRLAEVYQAFGVPWAINLDEAMGTKVFWGPRKLMKLKQGAGETSGFGFASPNAPLEYLENSRRNLVREAADDWGLDGDMIYAQMQTGDVQSGEARKVGGRKLWSRAEKFQGQNHRALVRAVQMSMVVWKRYAGDAAAKVPEDPNEIDVDVIYPQSQRFMDDPQQFAHELTKADRGITSLVAIFRKAHPEVTSNTQAEKEIRENLAKNAELAPVPTGFQAALGAAASANQDDAPEPGATATSGSLPAGGDAGGALPATDPAAVAADPSAAVADTGLNGAQIDGMLKILEEVGVLLTPEAAIESLSVSLPLVPLDRIRKIVGGVIAKPAPAPVTPTAAPGAPPEPPPPPEPPKE